MQWEVEGFFFLSIQHFCCCCMLLACRFHKIAIGIKFFNIPHNVYDSKIKYFISSVKLFVLYISVFKLYFLYPYNLVSVKTLEFQSMFWSALFRITLLFEVSWLLLFYIFGECIFCVFVCYLFLSHFLSISQMKKKLWEYTLILEWIVCIQMMNHKSIAQNDTRVCHFFR